MRICTRCKTPKEEDEFHNRYNRKSGKGKHSRCKECHKEWQTEYDHTRNQKVRLDVIQHYSEGLMKCTCCGESQERFLCIDHMQNDGAEHRKQIGKSTNIYRWLIREKYPTGFQVLCFNCNCGKAFNKGTCPHEEM